MVNSSWRVVAFAIVMLAAVACTREVVPGADPSSSATSAATPTRWSSPARSPTAPPPPQRARLATTLSSARPANAASTACAKASRAPARPPDCEAWTRSPLNACGLGYEVACDSSFIGTSIDSAAAGSTARPIPRAASPTAEIAPASRRATAPTSHSGELRRALWRCRAQPPATTGARGQSPVSHRGTRRRVARQDVHDCAPVAGRRAGQGRDHLVAERAGVDVEVVVVRARVVARGTYPLPPPPPAALAPPCTTTVCVGYAKLLPLRWMIAMTSSSRSCLIFVNSA